MQLILILLGWSILGYFCRKMAIKRNRNPTVWFILGFSLGIIALGLLYFIPKKQLKEKDNQLKNPILDSGKSEAFNANQPLNPPHEPSPLTPDWYYIDQDQNQQGPVSVHVVREALKKDLLTPQSFVWNESFNENWKRIKEVEELSPSQ